MAAVWNICHQAAFKHVCVYREFSRDVFDETFYDLAVSKWYALSKLEGTFACVSRHVTYAHSELNTCGGSPGNVSRYFVHACRFVWSLHIYRREVTATLLGWLPFTGDRCSNLLDYRATGDCCGGAAGLRDYWKLQWIIGVGDRVFIEYAQLVLRQEHRGRSVLHGISTTHLRPY
jgi:hypothetical protein